MAIKINKKKWDKCSDEEKISYCDGLLDDAKQARLRRDIEWYLNNMFLEGNHYAYINTTTNALERPLRRRGEVRLVVNKIKSSIRAVKNYSTRFYPKWEVVPGDIDPETIVNARRSGKMLDYLYRHLHLESLVSGLVETGLTTSVGWVEMDWDDKADNGLGQVVFKLHDPYDIWVDRGAFLYAGKVVGRFICKAIRRPLDEVFYDERYNKKTRTKVEPDEDLAASPIKAKIIRKEQGSSHEDKIKRTTVKEFFLWDDEKNDEGGNVKLFTYAGKQVLREDDLKEKEYPLYLYQIPQDPLKIYHRSWVADSVPLNKALDRTLSQKVMYVNQALIYRIIAEKGHGVESISNEMGEVIEINKNRDFKQWQMQPLPTAVDSLSNDLNLYIEDMMSAHEASIGRMPSGARAGKIIEALQAAESNNLAGIRQSLESFLSIIGKRALEIVADKYVASRVIKITEPEMDMEGEPVNYLKVIGESAKQKPKEATIITGDDEVIVKIGSWLGYTLEAQRETLMEMADRGYIPTEEILRQFEFPNIRELSKKAKEERLEQHQLKAEIAGRSPGAGGGMGAGMGAGGGIDMVALADRENKAMLEGEDLGPTPGATPEHTQAHSAFIETNIFAAAPPDRQEVILAHRDGELAQQQQAGAMPMGGMMQGGVF